MGRMTSLGITPFATLSMVLVCSCGPAGVGGSGANPPEPVRLLDMAPSLSVPAQPATELFATDVPLEFVLAADFDQLKKDRSQNEEDRPAQILVRRPDGEAVEVPMKVRTRGNFRLQERICREPPLRLNFTETEPQGTVLDGQGKLKLVTHCRDSDRYEQNLLEEFLAYRIYNQLTDMSHRVQLARVTYLDTSGKNKPITRMAFIIEDADSMASRLGGVLINAPAASPDDFDQDQLSLMYLFQFMIGNVDWGAGTSHNVRILGKDLEYYPIPYDFDWSGLVDAPYAGPNPMTQPFHDSVRERLYWGGCLQGLDYQRLFGRFNEEREAILALARNQVGLSDRNVEWAVRYLEEFYSIINDPRRAEREIVSACRKW
jgi:hypothetical protein